MSYVLVDGPDGTGKTTFTREVEDRLPSSRRFCFPTQIPDQDDFDDPTSELLFYLNDFDAQLIQKDWEEEHFILDRSFVSTMAYQGFCNRGYKKRGWAIETTIRLGTKMIENDDVYAVHLTCDRDERIDRLSEKDKREDRVQRLSREAKKKKMEELDRTFKRSYGLLRERRPAFNFLTLDSTDTTAEQLVSRFLKAFRSE